MAETPQAAAATKRRSAERAARPPENMRTPVPRAAMFLVPFPSRTMQASIPGSDAPFPPVADASLVCHVADVSFERGPIVWQPVIRCETLPDFHRSRLRSIVAHWRETVIVIDDLWQWLDVERQPGIALVYHDERPRPTVPRLPEHVELPPTRLQDDEALDRLDAEMRGVLQVSRPREASSAAPPPIDLWSRFVDWTASVELLPLGWIAAGLAIVGPLTVLNILDGRAANLLALSLAVGAFLFQSILKADWSIESGALVRTRWWRRGDARQTRFSPRDSILIARRAGNLRRVTLYQRRGRETFRLSERGLGWLLAGWRAKPRHPATTIHKLP